MKVRPNTGVDLHRRRVQCRNNAMLPKERLDSFSRLHPGVDRFQRRERTRGDLKHPQPRLGTVV